MPKSNNIKFALMIKNADELIKNNLNEKTLRKIFSQSFNLFQL